MINVNIKNIKKLFSKGKIALLPIALSCSMMVTSCDSNNIFSSKSSISIERAKKLEIQLSEKDYMFNNFKLKTIESAPNDLEDLSSVFSKKLDTSKITTFCSVKDFCKNTNEENVTWNDIHETLESCNIDNNVKDALRKGITNLENNNFNMELGLLNYNLKRLQINYGDYSSERIKGRFTCTNGITELDNTILNTDEFERIVIHEILGHGMTMAYDEESSSFTTPDLQYALLDEKDNIILLSSVGSCFSEAIAEIIAAKATNDKIDFNDTEYAVYVQYLELLLKSVNITEEEFANNGTKYLVDTMNDKGIYDAIDYVYDMDARKTEYEKNEPFVSIYGYVDEMESQYLVYSAFAKYGNYINYYAVEKYINACLKHSKSLIDTEEIDGKTCISWNNEYEGEIIDLDFVKEDALSSFYCEEDVYQKTLK